MSNLLLDWHTTSHTTCPTTDKYGGRIQLCYECTSYLLTEFNASNQSISSIQNLLSLLSSCSGTQLAAPGTPPSLLIKPLLVIILKNASSNGSTVEQDAVTSSAIHILCKLTNGILQLNVFQDYVNTITSSFDILRSASNMSYIWSSINQLLDKNKHLILHVTEHYNLFTSNISMASSTTSTTDDWRIPYFSILEIIATRIHQNQNNNNNNNNNLISSSLSFIKTYFEKHYDQFLIVLRNTSATSNNVLQSCLHTILSFSKIIHFTTVDQHRLRDLANVILSHLRNSSIQSTVIHILNTMLKNGTAPSLYIDIGVLNAISQFTYNINLPQNDNNVSDTVLLHSLEIIAIVSDYTYTFYRTVAPIIVTHLISLGLHLLMEENIPANQKQLRFTLLEAILSTLETVVTSLQYSKWKKMQSHQNSSVTHEEEEEESTYPLDNDSFEGCVLFAMRYMEQCYLPSSTVTEKTTMISTISTTINIITASIKNFEDINTVQPFILHLLHIFNQNTTTTTTNNNNTNTNLLLLSSPSSPSAALHSHSSTTTTASAITPSIEFIAASVVLLGSLFAYECDITGTVNDIQGTTLQCLSKMGHYCSTLTIHNKKELLAASYGHALIQIFRRLTSNTSDTKAKELLQVLALNMMPPKMMELLISVHEANVVIGLGWCLYHAGGLATRPSEKQLQALLSNVSFCSKIVFYKNPKSVTNFF